MADSKSDGKKEAGVAIVVPKISKTFTEAIDSMVLAKWPPASASAGSAGSAPLKPHEVRIAVHAVSLNFFDLLGAVGRYQYKYEPPYVLGSEASGVITAVGSKVKAYSVGQSTGRCVFTETIRLDARAECSDFGRVFNGVSRSRAAVCQARK